MVSFDETLDYLRNLLAYSTGYAPASYPPEDRASWAAEYEKMHGTLASLFERCRSHNKKHWLQLALWDLERANELFLEGNDARGERLLQDCQGYLSNAASGKKHTIDFVVGTDGAVRTE